MKKFLFVLGVLLVVFASILLIGISLLGEPARPREPSYQGKKLTAWLNHIAISPDQERLQDEQAVLAIGTNAIPFLLWELQVKHSPLKAKIISLVISQRFLASLRSRFVSWHEPTESSHHRRAITGFRALGAVAKPALPALAECVKNPDAVLQATTVLAAYDNYGKLYLGPGVYAPLLIALTNQNPEVRRLAANGLNQAQTNASLVVPALLRTLHDPDPI